MIRLLLLLGLLAAPVSAQDLSGLARLDVAQSRIDDHQRGLAVHLYLSQVVPYRVFTLDAPRRLIIDFREVDFRGASSAGLLDTDRATDVRFGVLRPGWSRMVLDLDGPFALDQAGMLVDDIDNTAQLTINLRPVPADEFSQKSGAPEDPNWVYYDLHPAEIIEQNENERLVVVIDPGHGGIDPGAQRDGIDEADLMLTLAQELAEAFTRAGMLPVLTRHDDSFVSLAERMTIARTVNADLLLSLHADALEGEQASGASVYTLSDDAEDTASSRMAERHDRADLIAGLDLTHQDDTIATVLMDLARLETEPQTDKLADAVVTSLRRHGAPLNTRPRRQAGLAVLSAADFPSILIEVGFLSSEQDRQRLLNVMGREPIVRGIVQAVQSWAVEQDALRSLVRQ